MKRPDVSISFRWWGRPTTWAFQRGPHGAFWIELGPVVVSGWIDWEGEPPTPAPPPALLRGECRLTDGRTLAMHAPVVPEMLEDEPFIRAYALDTLRRRAAEDGVQLDEATFRIDTALVNPLWAGEAGGE